MLSQLGPLFKTVLRQAESADTRLAIRRDEKQEGRRNGGDARDEAPDDSLWQDSAAVSITALHAFLIEFLKGRGETPPEISSPAADENLILTPEYRPPATTTAARAVRAYGAAAADRDAQLPAQPQPQVSPPAEDVDLVRLLQADEIRTIYQLIRELDALAARGIQTLTIERADTFLEALVAAVAAEKVR